MAGATALEERDTAGHALPQARGRSRRRRSSLHNYVALPRREAFRIEYWALEEAKLQRMPPEREFSRKIALVVGGGSGIGREVALQLARRGGARRRRRPERARAPKRPGPRRRASSSPEWAWRSALDLTSREPASRRRFARRVLQFGGVRRASSTRRRSTRRPIRRRRAGSGVGEDAADQRHGELRARAGSGASAEGAEPSRVDRPDQLGERGRAQAAAARRTTSARRRSTT